MTDAIDSIGSRAADELRSVPAEEDVDDAREQALQARLRDHRHPLTNGEWHAIQSELGAIRRRRAAHVYALTKSSGSIAETPTSTAPQIPTGGVGLSVLLAVRSGVMFTTGQVPREPASMTREQLVEETKSLEAGISLFKPPLAPPRAEVERLAVLERELARRPPEKAGWPARATPVPLPHEPLGVVPGDMTTPAESLTRAQVVQQIDELTALAGSGARLPDQLTTAAAKRLGDLHKRLAYLDAAGAPACDAATPTPVDSVGAPPPDLTADRLIDLAESRGARFTAAERQLLRTRFEEWKRAQCAATGVDPTTFAIREDPTRPTLGLPKDGASLADQQRELQQRLAIIASLANNPLAALALARSWVTNDSVEAAWKRVQLADGAAGLWAALAAAGQTQRHPNTAAPTRVTVVDRPSRPTALQRAQSARNWRAVAPFVGRRVSEGIPPGYALVERGGRKSLRRNDANDALWPRLHVDQRGRIEVGSVERLSVRGALRRALGAAPAHHQAHHVVPDQVVRDHPLFQEARRRTRPYDVDRKSNGAYLPDGPEVRPPNAPKMPVHNGPHPRYTMLAQREANLVQHLLIQRYGSLANVPDDVLANATAAVEGRMRRLLAEWTTTTGDRLQ